MEKHKKPRSGFLDADVRFLAKEWLLKVYPRSGRMVRTPGKKDNNPSRR